MAEDGAVLRTALASVLAFTGGIVLARAHLAALALNVRLYLSPGAPWRAAGLHALRVALVVSAFTLAAPFGAAALLAALAGFTLGRARALDRHR